MWARRALETEAHGVGVGALASGWASWRVGVARRESKHCDMDGACEAQWSLRMLATWETEMQLWASGTR